MVNIIVPSHVFISYAHDDKEFAEKIVSDLKKAGISTWIDRTNLMPGTLNWDKKIREALRYSFAVLVLASPASGQSDVVQGELKVAKSLECPIYPVWIRGKWEESVPLSMMNMQYIDCREDRYNYGGLMQILQALMQVIQDRAIRHFPYKAIDDYLLPEGYITITLGPENYVAMRPASYDTLQSLLDDLYLNYLINRYEPFTYGQEWVLASGMSRASERLLVPWNWALEKGEHQPISRTNPSWQLSMPRTYGLVERQWWDIIDKSDRFDTKSDHGTIKTGTYGIATNDQGLGKYLLLENDIFEPDGMKAGYSLPRTLNVRTDKGDAYMKILPMEMLNQNDYEFLFVFANNGYNDDMTGKVFIPGEEWLRQFEYYL